MLLKLNKKNQNRIKLWAYTRAYTIDSVIAVGGGGRGLNSFNNVDDDSVIRAGVNTLCRWAQKILFLYIHI